MLAKFLGFGDLISTIIVLLLHYHIVGWRCGIIISAYLIIKGIIFKGSIVSLTDIFCGIYIFIMIFVSSTIINWIIIIYLFQKACFSLAAN